MEAVARATTAMITDGNPGNGGFFGGNGRSEAGGGGAGLGGAIFNDSGIVVIRNSTFTANSAVGGVSLGGAPEGRAGGGAIFSRNGQLTVLNATINGNSSVIGLGGGIMVAQEESAPTLFVLQNTIVANNGEAECAVTGSSIAGAFAGNLITQNAIGQIMREKTFVACPGVVTTADPQLAPLALNAGPTPTMAIAASSPAWNTADFGTSLGFDQRGQRRPALGGVDIGAFELCLQNLLDVQLPCVIVGLRGVSWRRRTRAAHDRRGSPGKRNHRARRGNDQRRPELARGPHGDSESRLSVHGLEPERRGSGEPVNGDLHDHFADRDGRVRGVQLCGGRHQFDRPHLRRFHDQPGDEAVRADGDAQEQFVHHDCRTAVAGAGPADGERHALQRQWHVRR